MLQSLKDATPKEIILWLLRKRRRLRVTGASMQPLLQPGEEILIDINAYKKASPQIGDIIVAFHPYRPKFPIVKRIVSIEKDGSLFLQGDNTLESTDSRSYGAIQLDQILGKVTSRFA
ncbi:MAG: nickel-type superoxide dismutase maturation protease [Xenococcaceae cyanobacterium MO_167.B27]|nr:nickel-type superoxide dismutase maturation protease [Xenococcaceae cyanobacterium MO_167.B27]